MASPWLRAKLGEVTVNHDARRVPVREADRRPGPYPYYGASGVVDYVAEYLFEGLHLLIAEDGENLRTRQTPVAFLAKGRFWVNNHAHIVTGNDRADTRYLCYALAVTDISGYLTGSAMPKLSQRAMNAIEVPLPPMEVQQQVVAVLGSLDDKIEHNRRTSEALERLARGIFKAWFVDFEPVKAKAAGASSYPGMPPDAFASLPTRFVDSELGPVPEGWEVGTIGTLASLIKDQLHPQQYADEMFEHHSIPAYDSGQSPAHESGATIKSQKFVVPEGCILLSKLNPRIPRIWLPSRGMHRQIASTEFLVMAPRTNWGRYYLFCLFSQPEFRESLAQGASGTSNSHQRVRPADVLAKPCIVPATLAERFGDLVAPMFKLSSAAAAESRKLAELRDYFLPRLLSGRVRVGSGN